jgi:hypothetical protein
MMIATSSWFTKLNPEIYARISISRGIPRGQTEFRRYPALNPGPWFNSVNEERYKELYFAEVLGPLNPSRTVEELMALAGGKIPVLLCWEPATPRPEWCHRGFVSAWLHDTLGLEVYEVGHGVRLRMVAPESAADASTLVERSTLVALNPTAHAKRRIALRLARAANIGARLGDRAQMKLGKCCRAKKYPLSKVKQTSVSTLSHFCF